MFAFLFYWKFDIKCCFSVGDYLNDKLEVKRSQFQVLNDNANILNIFCIDHKIKPKSFGMRCAWLWADTWKAQGEYKKLLLFFFHCASDQKLGKYRTADCYKRLCSSLKILKSLVLAAVSYKMDWRTCKCLRPSNSCVLPQPGLHEERCSTYETGIFMANCIFLLALMFLASHLLAGVLATLAFWSMTEHCPSLLRS